MLNDVGLVVRDSDMPLGYYQSTGMGVSVGPQSGNCEAHG